MYGVNSKRRREHTLYFIINKYQTRISVQLFIADCAICFVLGRPNNVVYNTDRHF